MTKIDRLLLQPFGLQKKRLKILEIGCLEGNLVRHLSFLGHQTLGIDVNVPVISKSIKENGTNLMVASIEDDILDLGIDYDVIVSFHVFEHLRDPLTALQKARTMIKKGGAILLEVPADNKELINSDHFHFFTEKSLHMLLHRVFGNSYVVSDSYLMSGLVEATAIIAVGIRSETPK